MVSELQKGFPFGDFSRVDDVLDLKGLRCPMPLLKTKQRLNQLAPANILYVVTTDQGSVRDFSSFLALSRHELLEQSSTTGVVRSGSEKESASTGGNDSNAATEYHFLLRCG